MAPEARLPVRMQRPASAGRPQKGLQSGTAADEEALQAAAAAAQARPDDDGGHRRETVLRPEPPRASVVAVAHAIIRFFQRAWQEITGVGCADTAPKLLPPGKQDAKRDE